MIPNPFGNECKVIYRSRGTGLSRVYIYGPVMMQRVWMDRAESARMLVRIEKRMRLGKGNILPSVDGWTYYP
jgi:hypothetical protein